MSAVFSYADNDPSADRQVAQLRIPPHSIEAESSVLGGLLNIVQDVPVERIALFAIAGFTHESNSLNAATML